MPSPFPGMDPYLEAPGLWPALHPLLISGLVRTLNLLLPRAYFAKSGERVYVVEDGRSIYPDAAVLRHDASFYGPTAATLESDPPVVLTADPVEVREHFVEIVRADAPGAVVTCIEVLSRETRFPGTPGESST